MSALVPRVPPREDLATATTEDGHSASGHRIQICLRRGSAARSRAYRQRRSTYREPLSRYVDAAISEALAFVVHSQSRDDHRVCVAFSHPLFDPRLIIAAVVIILQARESFAFKASVMAVRARLSLGDTSLDGAHVPALDPGPTRYPPKLRGIAADALDRLARLTLPKAWRGLGHEEAERRIRAADLNGVNAYADEHDTLLVDAVIEHCLNVDYGHGIAGDHSRRRGDGWRAMHRGYAYPGRDRAPQPWRRPLSDSIYGAYPTLLPGSIEAALGGESDCVTTMLGRAEAAAGGGHAADKVLA